MRLLLMRPELALRDCKVCQGFRHDEHGPILWRGKPQPRTARDVPACATPAGCPKGRPNALRSLTDDNLLCYRHYQRCRATGQWPDDPLVHYHARILDTIERQCSEARMLDGIRDAMRQAAT